MPESNHPFAAPEVLSTHDITHQIDSANDDLPELNSDEIADVDLHFCDDDAPPTPFEPSETLASVGPVALARVSFSEQATLSFDGYQETFQVTLLNLSTRGVACLGPHGLNVADAVRLAFALAPGEGPTSLLCEVMWSQPSTPREDAYGLRFTALDEHLSACVEDIVRQRCGMAGLAVSSRVPAKPSVAPWVVACAGAALGMLATLAAMVLVESDLFANPAALSAAPGPLRVPAGPAPIDARVGAKEASGTEAVAQAPVSASAAKPASAAQAPDSSVGLANPAKGAAAKGAPAASTTVAATTDEAAILVPPSAVVISAPRPEEAQAPAPSVRFIGDLRVEETPDTIALTLRISGPAMLHEEFWLSSPPRLVVDVPAARNGLQRHQFDVASPLVARVRVGDHADKVRFVIETGKNVSSRVRAKASGNALRIELRRHS